MRNAFGDLITPPDQLSRLDRIDALRRAAGTLQTDPRTELRWIGQCLTVWLEQGGPLDVVLGVRPEPGSHLTAQQRVRQAEIDSLLLRLSVECGGDTPALQALQGARCRFDLLPILDRLDRLKAPKSMAAFTRARKRSSRPR